MELTAWEMKKSIEKIEKRLDEVSPVDFDCGKLCGEVCCVYDADESHTEELVLYLLPGEELMYEGSPDFEDILTHGKTAFILSNASTLQNATGPLGQSNAEHFH